MTTEFLHYGPQMAPAITTCSSSRNITLSCCGRSFVSRYSGAHSTWNHLFFHKPPHPNQPDASVVAWCSTCSFPCSLIIETLFHASANMAHQIMSKRAVAFKRMWWKLSWVPLTTSNSGQRNLFPSWITLLAWGNFPTGDSNSFFQHDRLPDQSDSYCWSFDNFSCGSRISKATESSSSPTNIRRKDGPSSLFAATSKPSSPNVSSTTCISLAHVSLSGPIIKKLSR